MAVKANAPDFLGCTQRNLPLVSVTNGNISALQYLAFLAIFKSHEMQKWKGDIFPYLVSEICFSSCQKNPSTCLLSRILAAKPISSLLTEETHLAQAFSAEQGLNLQNQKTQFLTIQDLLPNQHLHDLTT